MAGSEADSDNRNRRMDGLGEEIGGEGECANSVEHVFPTKGCLGKLGLVSSVWLVISGQSARSRLNLCGFRPPDLFNGSGLCSILTSNALSMPRLYQDYCVSSILSYT